MTPRMLQLAATGACHDELARAQGRLTMIDSDETHGNTNLEQIIAISARAKVTLMPEFRKYLAGVESSLLFASYSESTFIESRSSRAS